MNDSNQSEKVSKENLLNFTKPAYVYKFAPGAPGDIKLVKTPPPPNPQPASST